MAKGEAWAETTMGAAVLVAAAGFLIYALSHAGAMGGGGGYTLMARFGQVGSLAPGVVYRGQG